MVRKWRERRRRAWKRRRYIVPQERTVFELS
jgi:hypothetical protein